MTELTAHTAALSGYSGAQQSAASDVASLATGQRTPAAELSMTFGVIGAEFLAAMSYTLDQRAADLDALAHRHQMIADGTETGRRALTDQDTENSTTIRSAVTDRTPGRVAPGDQALRL